MDPISGLHTRRKEGKRGGGFTEEKRREARGVRGREGSGQARGKGNRNEVGEKGVGIYLVFTVRKKPADKKRGDCSIIKRRGKKGNIASGRSPQKMKRQTFRGGGEEKTK